MPAVCNDSVFCSWAVIRGFRMCLMTYERQRFASRDIILESHCTISHSAFSVTHVFAAVLNTGCEICTGSQNCMLIEFYAGLSLYTARCSLQTSGVSSIPREATGGPRAVRWRHVRAGHGISFVWSTVFFHVLFGILCIFLTDFFKSDVVQ